MGFSRQEYWSGLPFPPPGDLPNPGIKPVSPALAGRFFTTEPPGKPICPGQTCTLGHARCRWLSPGLQAPPGAQRERGVIQKSSSPAHLAPHPPLSRPGSSVESKANSNLCMAASASSQHQGNTASRLPASQPASHSRTK